MKKRVQLSFRELLSCAILLAGFALLVCVIHSSRKESAAFREFSQSLFVREMTSNAINLHYGLAHPENFGITDYPVVLPLYSPNAETTCAGDLSQILEELRAIDRGSLSEEDAYARDCLEKRLIVSMEEAGFPYYSDLFSPVSGIQGQLPILLSEYQFRTKKDVEDYLELLGQTRAFLASLLIRAKEKSAAGLSPSLVSLRAAQEQCDAMITLEELRGGTHFLQTSFQERLRDLSAVSPLSPEETRRLEAKNDALLKTVLHPAFQDLREGLKTLEEGAPEASFGLASLPRGREYYESLLTLETGSGKTPEEMRSLLRETLTRECKAISELAAACPECLSGYGDPSWQNLGFSNAYEVLEDLKTRMQADFPTLGELGGDASLPLPSATLKTVSPSLQKFSAPAFYLTSPVDDVSTNIIYVNPADSLSGLSLYVTLAHEGYPGHLYQNACMATHLLSLSDGRVRQLLDWGGYQEGWALYVEQFSYDYAARLFTEQNRTRDAVRAEMEKHHRSLQLCLYSMMDLMIHYDGASPGEIAAFLSPFGVRDEGAVQSIYDYICQAPCNYPKYYLGYLEILELREAARQFWGEGFSNRRFHLFLLEWGPADFLNLRGKIR